MADLTTIEAVRSLLGQGAVAGTETDNMLRSIISAASTLALQYLSRDIEAKTYTAERYNGNGLIRLILRHYPVNSVTSVVIDARSVEPEKFYIFDDMVYLKDDVFYRGVHNVTVTYNAGYAVIPADIQHAVAEIAALKYTQRQSIGFLSKQIAGQSTNFDKASIPASALDVLKCYRRVAYA
jgi:hypothetical protein